MPVAQTLWSADEGFGLAIARVELNVSTFAAMGGAIAKGGAKTYP